MDLSVESLCNTLARSHLLPPADVRTIHQRWRAEARDKADDHDSFARWLVANQYVTEFQAALLARGQTDRLFLGPYKLLGRIGRGRMASVFKAVHNLGQMVAIKVLAPSKARDLQTLGRFQREARLGLRLKHPNVVRTFQLGEADGLHYLVLEYFDGETLEDVLKRRGKLPPLEAVRLVHQALLGLQHLQENDLVHRDLKPANLMIVPAASAGGPDTTARSTVKILDMGLSRALFDEGDPAGKVPDAMTNKGDRIGTADYMAPEQAQNAHAADIRADIYSLGCVLYHAIAGQPPFPDANVVRQMIRHATEAPQPLAELNPAAPEGLQQILDWMLVKDPGQRYPTPQRAAGALQVYLASEAEAASPLEAEPQIQPYLRWLESEDRESTAAPVPAAPPVAALPACARVASSTSTATALRAGEVDVELVPAQPPSKRLAAARASMRLSRREWNVLAVGAGLGAMGVFFAEAIGWLIAGWLRRMNTSDTPPGENSSGIGDITGIFSQVPAAPNS